MHTPNLNQSHGLPFCPACSCRHYPATNGAGYKVWCNGARVETDAEIQARETQETHDRARRATARAKVEKEYKQARAKSEASMAKARAKSEASMAKARADAKAARDARALIRCIALAERATRPHAPALELWEARTLPGAW